MKKKLYLLLVLGAVLSSCTEDAIIPDGSNSETVNSIIYASTEGNDTKTSLSGSDASGYEVLWSEGDEIAFDGGRIIYALAEGANTTSATFSAKSTPAVFDDGESYEAIYPASFAKSKSWPSSQAWSRTVTQVPMSAVGISNGSGIPTLAFKNLGGLLRVRISAADPLVITKVEISSDDPLAGSVMASKYSFTSPSAGSGITILDPKSSIFKSVIMDCGDGVEIATGESEDFWFALPASVSAEVDAAGALTSLTQSGYHNFKIKIYDASGKVCIKSLKSEEGLVIERSKVTRASFTVSNSSFGDAPGDYLCFTSTSVIESEIRMCLSGSVPETHAFEYSKDGYNWLPVVLNTTRITLSSVGEKVYFRSSDDAVAESFSMDYKNRYYFSCAYTTSFRGNETLHNSLTISGNIMSLLDKNCETTDLAGDNCFNYLFLDCRPVESVSGLELPATKLTAGCYSAMFSGCSNLKDCPDLPATELARGCYSYMFSGCSQLAASPELNAAELAPYCYGGMFSLCSSLDEAPDLPAKALPDSCYNSMFRGTAITKTPEMKAETIGKESCSMMFYGCKQLTEASDLEAKTLSKQSYYSMFSGCESLTSAPAIKAETLAESCCYGMFNGCISLVDVPALPTAPLAPYCYHWMFDGCKSLTDIPELPATELAEGCYSYMFSTCQSMKNAPVLPAQELAPYCYQGMFWYCSSLEECPELIAEEMAEGCYANMFEGCSALTEAAELPSIQLAPSCYEEMFAECDNLHSGPELPATDLKKSCYAWMFLYCNNLEEGPELPATTMAESCYYEMFYACPKLKKAPALPAKVLAKSCYDNMFGGCAALESAPELPATVLSPYCYRGMFYQCTKLTTAPSLPAENLAEGCYQYMFERCSALEDAPVLPAAALAKNCYVGMFANCSSLASVEVGFTSWDPGDGSVPTKNWMNNVGGSGSFICPSTLAQNRGVDYIPEDWSVTSL